MSYENFIKAYEKGSVYFSKKYWNRIIEIFLNDDFDAIQLLIDDEKAEAYPASAFVDTLKNDLQTDLDTLIKIKSWWDKIDYDPKLKKFVDELKNLRLLTENKLIIFTESKETAEYLFENLEKQLKEKPILYHGRSSQSDLNTVISNFDAKARNKKDDFRILITTEVLSEGINLHRSNVVINYDIPWNPTRMIQRVGRINRVDTPFDKIYTFNFFPTEQSNDLIKLKEAAIAKINYFIEMLGNDAKLLTDGEEIKSFELFNKLTSKEFLTGEDEEDESELKFLNVISDIRDNNEILFIKIKHLPKKARSSREIEAGINLLNVSLLTYFRKGKLEKFYLASESGATELDFITAAKLFEATPETKRQKISTNYHALLDKNKTELINNLTEEEILEITTHRGRDNAIRILRILKSKEIRQYSGFTEIDDLYIKNVIKLLEDGVLPKSVTKRMFGEIKNLTHPLKIIGAATRNLPDEFFKGNLISHDQLMENPSEVILSECFVK